MNETIRPLTEEDLHYYERMETGIEEDYMLRIFDRITQGANQLFGLFSDDQLVAVAGYTVFKKHFAMLGRLRTDRRFRKKGFGTEIVNYSLEHALDQPSINWIGANTEQHNEASRKVLKKIGLPPVETLYAAQSTDLTSLTGNGNIWHENSDNLKKWEWIRQTYLDSDFGESVFPLEAYYPFPADPALFEGPLNQWRLFENEDKTRFMLIEEEEKGKHLLHVVYPWHDFRNQPGFFETIQSELTEAQKTKAETTVWIDLTELDVLTLPDTHPFDLPSPWILHGAYKQEILGKDLSRSINTVDSLLADVEKELKELTETVGFKESELEALLKHNEEISQSIDKDKE